jgi:LPS export ABC transporter protein LptC
LDLLLLTIGFSSEDLNSVFHIKSFFKAAATGSCFFLLACKNDYKEVQEMALKPVAVDRVTEVQSYLSQGGMMRAKLTSPLMITTRADTTRIEFPETLKVDFFNDSSKIESRLFAKYGRYYQAQRLVFLKDSVIIYNIKGDTLKCPELWWDQNKEIIYTDKSIKLRRPNEKIDGTGLTANQNFTNWTIQNATGPIMVPDSMMAGF